MKILTDEIKAKLKSDSIRLGSFIGEGAQGEVYALKGSNNVLKMTRDSREARSMQVVKDHPQKNIVRVYNVWKYKQFNNAFFIEEEKLKPLPFQMEMAYIIGSDKILDMVDVDLPGDIVEEHDEVAIKKVEGVIDSFEGNIRDFLEQTIEIAHQLKALNIKWPDYHTGNIMMAGKIMKVIDLGLSKSPPAAFDIREHKMKLQELIATIDPASNDIEYIYDMFDELQQGNEVEAQKIQALIVASLMGKGWRDRDAMGVINSIKGATSELDIDHLIAYYKLRDK